MHQSDIYQPPTTNFLPDFHQLPPFFTKHWLISFSLDYHPSYFWLTNLCLFLNASYTWQNGLVVWTFYLRAIRFWLYRIFYLLICFILTLFNSGHITQQYINLQQINGIQTHNHLVRKRTLNHLLGHFGSMVECSFTN